MTGAVQRFAANTAGRDFVVGDMHGCMAAFNRLLTVANFNPSVDRVFSTGDLVDRGPDSMAALRLLELPWFFAVRGNHEQMMMDAFTGAFPGAYDLWESNGGAWGASLLPQETSAAYDLAARMPLVIIVGDGPERFQVLHAEFYGSDAQLESGEFSRGEETALLWGRDIFGVGAGSCLSSPTYVGHTIVQEPRSIGPLRYIDTGAFLDEWGERGGLTMVEPATGAIYSTCPPLPKSMRV